MTDNDQKSVYEGLMAMLEGEYPKSCPRCGRTYPDLASFVNQTEPVHGGTGLIGYDSGEPNQQVAMYRNCTCGSTMATFCFDRRDVSPAGLQRRERFDQLLEQLQSRGVEPTRARAELLAFLRGQPSPLLDNLFSVGLKNEESANNGSPKNNDETSSRT